MLMHVQYEFIYNIHRITRHILIGSTSPAQRLARQGHFGPTELCGCAQTVRWSRWQPRRSAGTVLLAHDFRKLKNYEQLHSPDHWFAWWSSPVQFQEPKKADQKLADISDMLRLKISGWIFTPSGCPSDLREKSLGTQLYEWLLPFGDRPGTKIRPTTEPTMKRQLPLRWSNQGGALGPFHQRRKNEILGHEAGSWKIH